MAFTGVRYTYGGNYSNYTPSRNPDMDVNFNTNYKGISVSQSYGGKIYTNQRYGKQLQWELTYTNLQSSDRTKLEALWNVVDGRRYSFTFSPDSGTTDYTVRFDDETLKFQQTSYNIYSVSFTITQEI